MFKNKMYSKNSKRQGNSDYLRVDKEKEKFRNFDL
jgi:hypothetical protein